MASAALLASTDASYNRMDGESMQNTKRGANKKLLAAMGLSMACVFGCVLFGKSLVPPLRADTAQSLRQAANQNEDGLLSDPPVQCDFEMGGRSCSLTATKQICCDSVTALAACGENPDPQCEHSVLQELAPDWYVHGLQDEHWKQFLHNQCPMVFNDTAQDENCVPAAFATLAETQDEADDDEEQLPVPLNISDDIVEPTELFYGGRRRRRFRIRIRVPSPSKLKCLGRCFSATVGTAAACAATDGAGCAAGLPATAMACQGCCEGMGPHGALLKAASCKLKGAAHKLCKFCR